ncbi:hypothetical protein [Lacinutrix himadriensis]|nr:hypothetical protein [Lacinutrix himadriensis]
MIFESISFLFKVEVVDVLETSRLYGTCSDYERYSNDMISLIVGG